MDSRNQLPEPSDGALSGDTGPGSLSPESTLAAPGAPPSAGTMIGSFRILEKIGEGGMGEVFLADQVSPVRRRVALKLIKLGMNTKEVVARFESERQALALLNHPNIAQVFDAGSMSDGRPYFVMEFVKGVSIQTYCDTHRLTVAERLQLFIQTCEGVQHAHQKGIIHRDLKPSNVLVTMLDGRPVPKIIDFGIAKATSQRLTEATLHTEIGNLVGTPEYMSPEQADYTLLDIDTRTDVYSLGAVLYELLTRQAPLSRTGLRSRDVGGIIRAIREVEPIRPSTRVAAATESRAEIAECFRTDPTSLTRELRGDLDWIVLKALEKERTRRYASASELAADIGRHLRHEPVLASPPSTTYRVRKFVRRHRLGVIAGATVGLALVAGVVGTGLGLLRAREAERRSRQEAETAKQVTSFLTDIFQVSDPGEARGNTVTAREILDKGAERIDRELNDQPLVKARLLDAMAGVYRNLGLYDQAMPLARAALAIREKESGPGSGEVASSLNRVGELLTLEFRYGDALPLHERAWGIRKRAGDRQSTEAAWSMYHLGSTLAGMGRFAEGGPLLDSALVIFRRPPHPNLLAAAWCLNELAIGQYQGGQVADAESLLRESVTLKRRALGPDHPDVAAGLANLGTVASELGRPAEGKTLIDQAIHLTELTAGTSHQNTGSYLAMRAAIEMQLGQLDSARVDYQRALDLARAHPADSAHLIAVASGGLAEFYAMRGAGERADFLYRQAMSSWERDGGASQIEYVHFLDEYSRFLRGAGRRSAADTLEARAQRIRSGVETASAGP
jgi:serine/threonine protein kinase/tetratricopeptide (TPR) repeat protein